MLKKYCRIIAATSIIASVATTAKGEGAWDIEYLPESDYDNAFGLGYYQYKQEGVGFYGNFQITLTEREPSYDSLNPSSFGDPITGNYKEIMLFNLGITKKVTSYLSGYAGVGYASATAIVQKYDSTRILASDGQYYVNDPNNDESGGNLNAGIIISMEKIIFNLGYHSFTSSAYFGIGGRF